MLADGTIAVAFVRSNGNILVRRFDTNLDFISQDTILIGPNDGADPALTAFANGSYLVTYSFDVGGGDSDILGRIVQANGEGVNRNLDTGAGLADISAAATLSSGDAAVVYADENSDVIRFVLVSPTGIFTASTAVPGTATDDDVLEFEADVAALTGGGFVVTWTDFDLITGQIDVRATILSNLGEVVQQDILVNTNTDDDQDEATVVALADGGFLVTWEDSDLGEVRAQRFSANGIKIGDEYAVKDGLATDRPDSVLLGDGRIAYAIGDISTGDADVVTSIWDPRTSPINGTNGSDTLTSRIDGATVNGLNGDDTLHGFAGVDILNGGLNNDTLNGGGNDDTITGGTQADTLDGGPGNDTFRIAGSEGFGDTFIGGIGDDRIEVTGPGAVILANFSAGGSSIQQWIGNGQGVFGNVGVNVLNFAALTVKTALPFVDGAGNNDTITGSSFTDDLRGGAGDDTLIGGGSIDTLTGGLGRDIMNGGTQRDIFDFNAANESVVGANRDVINAFQRNLDDIDLRTIDANPVVANNQAFTFINSQPFNNVRGELRFTDLGANCLVQGDINGNGTADFEIFVAAATLAQADFLL